MTLFILYLLKVVWLSFFCFDDFLDWNVIHDPVQSSHVSGNNTSTIKYAARIKEPYHAILSFWDRLLTQKEPKNSGLRLERCAPAPGVDGKNLPNNEEYKYCEQSTVPWLKQNWNLHPKKWTVSAQHRIYMTIWAHLEESVPPGVDKYKRMCLRTINRKPLRLVSFFNGAGAKCSKKDKNGFVQIKSNFTSGAFFSDNPVIFRNVPGIMIVNRFMFATGVSCIGCFAMWLIPSKSTSSPTCWAFKPVGFQ